MAILSYFGGRARVDFTPEMVNRFNGVAEVVFLNGELQEVNLKADPAPVVVNGKVTLKASEQGDTSNTKANGGKR